MHNIEVEVYKTAEKNGKNIQQKNKQSVFSIAKGSIIVGLKVQKNQ